MVTRPTPVRVSLWMLLAVASNSGCGPASCDGGGGELPHSAAHWFEHAVVQKQVGHTIVQLVQVRQRVATSSQRR